MSMLLTEYVVLEMPLKSLLLEYHRAELSVRHDTNFNEDVIQSG